MPSSTVCLRLRMGYHEGSFQSKNLGILPVGLHLGLCDAPSCCGVGDNLGCFQPNRVNRVTEPRCFARSKVHRTEYNRDNKLITYSVEPERVSVRFVLQPKFSADCWPLGRLLLLAIRTTYNQLTTCIEHCTTPLPDKGTLQDHVP